MLTSPFLTEVQFPALLFVHWRPRAKRNQLHFLMVIRELSTGAEAKMVTRRAGQELKPGLAALADEMDMDLARGRTHTHTHTLWSEWRWSTVSSVILGPDRKNEGEEWH